MFVSSWASATASRCSISARRSRRARPPRCNAIQRLSRAIWAGGTGMLKVDNLGVSYGHIEVLKGISFSVEMGEIVALIGGNGAGKTTTLSTISGLLRPTSGTISWKGEIIHSTAVETIVGAGLAHCPEGRRIFPGLTVRENLITGPPSRPHKQPHVET